MSKTILRHTLMIDCWLLNVHWQICHAYSRQKIRSTIYKYYTEMREEWHTRHEVFWMSLEKCGELGTDETFSKIQTSWKTRTTLWSTFKAPWLLSSHTMGSSMGRAMGTCTISQLIAVCIFFLSIHILVYS